MTIVARLRSLRIGAHAVWIGARDPAVALPVRMLGWAVAHGGRGIAMGQAPDEVIAAASEVTARDTDDGLSQALATF